MGIRETLRLIDGATALQSPTLSTAGIKSPWATGQLSRIVWADILGTEAMPVSRAEAMGIPHYARGRHLLCGAGSKIPMKKYTGERETAEQPAWLTSTRGRIPVQHRQVWTIDDLIWTGWSLWARENDDAGSIVDAVRVPRELWDFDDDSGVLVDGEPVNDDEVILIPGFHEGLLNFAPRSVRAARELETQWTQRAANPIPAVELHQTDDTDLLEEEIVAMVTDWKTAMADQGGAVAYTPKSIELRTHGTAATDLLIEGRNAAAVDAARNMNLPAALIDASNVNSTLTYETLEGRNIQFNDQSLSFYTDPIGARLSLDDITEPGSRIAFDVTYFTAKTPPPSGPPLED